MSQRLKILVILITFLSFQTGNAQEKKASDSTEIYSKIKNYSTKNKFTKTLHKLMFRSSKPKKNEAENNEAQASILAEGKIIRNINIITMDPFGQSVDDSTRVPKNWGERTGNRFHLKTKNIAIRNLLLFKRNTPYNHFIVKETERIIRTQRYISQVKITENLVSPASDSVDVTVRVLDSWSFLPKFSISSSRTKIGFEERNIMGIGHQLKYIYTHRFDDAKNANDVQYYIPNIMNTFITGLLYYNDDLNDYYNKGININRPFYSPLTKWAGGVELSQKFRRDSLPDADLHYEMQNFKTTTHDAWVGRAFPVLNNLDGEIEKTTNLVLAGRFLNLDYLESPIPRYDPEIFFSSENQILFSVGLNTQNYIKDRYLFRYGMTEDVPVGRLFSLTGGYQYKNQIWRPYFGGVLSFGNYFKYGYFSTRFEAGTFFHEGKTYQTAFNLQMNYFTNLFELGHWKIRQFVRPEAVIGVNRINSMGDMINLNSRNGFPAFEEGIYGTSKVMLTLQTQSYAPKEILGFRFNPYFNYTLGILGNESQAVFNGTTFSRISLGVLINNDYLVFSSIQLSISYYPSVPFEGGSNFKTNAYESTDFTFPNFSISKPATVDYN